MRENHNMAVTKRVMDAHDNLVAVQQNLGEVSLLTAHQTIPLMQGIIRLLACELQDIANAYRNALP